MARSELRNRTRPECGPGMARPTCWFSAARGTKQLSRERIVSYAWWNDRQATSFEPCTSCAIRTSCATGAGAAREQSRMNEFIDSSSGNLPRERHQRDHKAESTATGVSIDDFNTSERDATIG